MSSDLPPPIPAATLILMRHSKQCGAPEILMMERSATMAFAAGALVFPGGRIDPQDHIAGAELAPHLPDAPARIAAIRETIEETGIAPALVPPADPRDAEALRQALAAGEPFATALRRRRFTLDLGALTPFARWCPNFRETRRFDALFYIAQAPDGDVRASADHREAVSAFWASADSVLADIKAGRGRAIFPTVRNLERLARFATIDEARMDAAVHPVRRIVPWVEERHGRRFVCIPEGAGYPITSEPYESVLRR